MNKTLTYSNILVKNFIIIENLMHLHKYYFQRSIVSIAIFSDAICVTPINIFLFNLRFYIRFEELLFYASHLIIENDMIEKHLDSRIRVRPQ